MFYVPFGPAKEIYRAVIRMRSYGEQSIARYWRQLRADPGELCDKNHEFMRLTHV